MVTWTELIHKLLTHVKALDYNMRYILIQISEEKNVPLTKDLFLSWIQNKLKVSPDIAQKTWLIVEHALKKYAPVTDEPPMKKFKKLTK